MICAALPADVPGLARLMAGSCLQQRYGVSYSAALMELSDALVSGDLVLKSQAMALDGLAWVSFGPHILNGAAYLRLLLVATPGQGQGARLLLAAEAAARERANHLYLLVTVDNTRARRFYERYAYRHIGDLPGLVLPGLDEALYHKRLRGWDKRLSG